MNCPLIAVKAIKQVSVRVEATSTYYEFKNDILVLSLCFQTPLFPDDLKILSRPVGYISYKIDFTDGKTHDIDVYFDACSEISVKDDSEIISFGKDELSAYCGKGDKDVLESCGDDILIDWGTLHFVYPGAKYYIVNHCEKRELFKWNNDVKELNKPARVNDEYPVLMAMKSYKGISSCDGFLCVAYDDICSVESLGEKLPPYWKKEGDFETVLRNAVNEYPEVVKRCEQFDAQLRCGAEKISAKYADILALSYRQIIAGHKLVEKDDKLFLYSKECSSNGCIGTVDITYPSLPVFLFYNTELAKALLNPIFEYVETDLWSFDFAPHDLGIYPKANGQKYVQDCRKGNDGKETTDQMPVEECGNMLLCVAEICHYENSIEYARQNKIILGKWADYLVKSGYDPENQLCTDDFAGSFAHNCNLSIKAIVAISAWGQMLDKMNENGKYYTDKAAEYAKKWKEEAFDGDHYKLTFDRENTWSLKYNLVWDKILGLNVFDKDIFEMEVNYYKKQINEYGVPLDCRKSYTKSDWQMWTTCLSDDEEYRNMIIDAMWKMICDMPQRAPFSDWYDTISADTMHFHARTVQGGLFLPMLIYEI